MQYFYNIEVRNCVAIIKFDTIVHIYIILKTSMIHTQIKIQYDRRNQRWTPRYLQV